MRYEIIISTDDERLKKITEYLDNCDEGIIYDVQELPE